MSLFHHSLTFQPVDPLGDGLADEIAAEQTEDDAIDLSEQFDSSLSDKWQEIVADVEKDPSWFSFENED